MTTDDRAAAIRARNLGYTLLRTTAKETHRTDWWPWLLVSDKANHATQAGYVFLCSQESVDSHLTQWEERRRTA